MNKYVHANVVVGKMFGPDYPPGHVKFKPEAPFFVLVGNGDENPARLVDSVRANVLPTLPRVSTAILEESVFGKDGIVIDLVNRGWAVYPSVKESFGAGAPHLWLSDGKNSSIVMRLDVATKVDLETDGWHHRLAMHEAAQPWPGQMLLVGAEQPSWLKDLERGWPDRAYPLFFHSLTEALSVWYQRR